MLTGQHKAGSCTVNLLPFLQRLMRDAPPTQMPSQLRLWFFVLLIKLHWGDLYSMSVTAYPENVPACLLWHGSECCKKSDHLSVKIKHPLCPSSPLTL